MLGAPPPQLTRAQHVALTRAVQKNKDWRAGPPSVVSHRHADGSLISVRLTRGFGLHDKTGTRIGYGWFFESARQDNDAPTTARNSYSRQLAQSIRIDGALAVLHGILDELLNSDRAYFLSRDDERWTGWLASGEPREVAETLADLDDDVLDAVIGDQECVDATIGVSGLPTTVLLAPAGPPEARTILALVPHQEIADIDQQLAVALAAEAWATLRRLRAMDELEGKVEILEAIANVAGASGLDPSELSAHVAKTAAYALSCERAGLYLWDDQAELREEALYAADASQPFDPATRTAGVVTARTMLDTDGPFIVQDTNSSIGLDGPWGPRHGAVSVYGMPLQVGTVTVGMLVVAHTTANPRGFTSLCQQVAGALSQQAALAISNARLYDAELAATQRLKQVDQQRAEWISGLVHDLRSPVTAIYGFARILGQSSDSAEQNAESAAVIERQSLRVNRMLDDMLDSALAEAGQLGVQPFVVLPLHRAVNDAAMVADPEQQTRMDMRLDPDVMVMGHLGQLTRVVQNLLINALQHAPHDSTVRVLLCRERDQALLSVSDDGPGIPGDLAVFDRFVRGAQGGTGLGLYTVKQIVESHGGTIEVDHQRREGTTLHVRLPLHVAKESAG